MFGVNYTFDHDLFLALNFDGGPTVDRLMFTVSGTPMWIPLYLLILWLIYRKYGWRNMLLFFVLMVAAIGLADIVCGIFKANGLLGRYGLLGDFQPRWRPMFTPELEGLAITPDSLVALRKAGLPGDWAVHVPVGAASGHYGTVSAHAATVVSLAVFSGLAIRRRWFTVLIVLCTLLICYSRIYLAKHFPMDIAWGTLVGTSLGCLAWWTFRKFARPTQQPTHQPAR